MDMINGRQAAIFRGVSSRDVVRSLLELHFPTTKTIADLTFGKGAFWFGTENVIGLDIAPRYGCQIRADARHVPLRNGAVDVAIFDPPFTWSRGQNPGSVGLVSDFSHLPRYEDLFRLVAEAARECRRIARLGAIAKMSDSIKHGAYHAVHCDVIQLFGAASLDDIAILDSMIVRPEGPNWGQQKHLRNTHSYFMVFKYDQR